MDNLKGRYTQKDFDDIGCPVCGGKIIYKFGSARCECDDWFAEDCEIEEIL